MKTLIALAIVSILCIGANAQKKQQAINKKDPAKKSQIAEASCGQCNFKMHGEGCALAVRIDGKSYFVEGTSIDEHGDAHAKEGFCNAVRKAEVQGEVKDGKFVATYFKLLPEVKKGKKS